MRKFILTVFLITGIIKCSAQDGKYKLTQFRELGKNDTLIIDIENIGTSKFICCGMPENKEDYSIGVRFLVIKSRNVFKVFEVNYGPSDHLIINDKILTTHFDKQKFYWDYYLSFKEAKKIKWKFIKEPRRIKWIFFKNPLSKQVTKRKLNKREYFNFLTSLEDIKFIVDRNPEWTRPKEISRLKLKINEKQFEKEFNSWIDLDYLKE